MGLTIPGTIDVLDTNTLKGFVPTGENPLGTMMLRLNQLISTHSPAVVNCCPCNSETSGASTAVFEMPCHASADALAYVIRLRVLASGNGQVEVEESSDGSSYSAVASGPWAAGVTGDGTFELTSVLAADTRYITVQITGSNDYQIHSIMVYPDEIDPIAAVYPGSGAIAFNDDAITVAGAPIHTEHWSRVQVTVDAVLGDRKQAVFSYVNKLYRSSASSGSASVIQRQVMAGCGLAERISTTVVVQVKATTFGSPPDGVVTVGQVDGASVTFAADGTHRSAPLTLTGDRPTVFVDCGDGASGIDIAYAVATWTPTDPSAAIIGSIDPPPKIEYLAAMDTLTIEALRKPYATTGMAIDSTNAASPFNWLHQLRIGPGAYALWPAVTRCTSGGGSIGPSLTNSSSSGATATDAIRVPQNIPGVTERFPIGTYEAAVNWGGTDYILVPVAANGEERLVVLTQSRLPLNEDFVSIFLQGFGGIVLPMPIADI